MVQVDLEFSNNGLEYLQYRYRMHNMRSDTNLFHAREHSEGKTIKTWRNLRSDLYCVECDVKLYCTYLPEEIYEPKQCESVELVKEVNEHM